MIFTDAETKEVSAGRNGELVFDRYRVSVWEDKVLERNDDDGCITM